MDIRKKIRQDRRFSRSCHPRQKNAACPVIRVTAVHSPSPRPCYELNFPKFRRRAGAKKTAAEAAGLYRFYCTFRNRTGATFGSSIRVKPPIFPSASEKKVSGRV